MRMPLQWVTVKQTSMGKVLRTWERWNHGDGYRQGYSQEVEEELGRGWLALRPSFRSQFGSERVARRVQGVGEVGTAYMSTQERNMNWGLG